MRARFCSSLLVISLCSLACSSNATKRSVQPSPRSTADNTETDSYDMDAGDFDAGNTSNCEPWPADKLAPLIGPFYFGDKPRPCRIKNTAQNASLFFQYKDNGQLDTLTNTTGKDQTTYEYNGDGLLVTANRRTSTTSVSTYEYAADRVTLTTVTGDQTSTQVYRLNANGYPTVITISPPQEGQPVRFVHEYDECRIVKRVAYNANGSVNDQLTVNCDYEESTGHMKGRHAPLDDQNYFYYDDSGNCVAAQ